MKVTETKRHQLLKPHTTYHFYHHCYLDASYISPLLSSSRDLIFHSLRPFSQNIPQLLLAKVGFPLDCLLVCYSNFSFEVGLVIYIYFFFKDVFIEASRYIMFFQPSTVIFRKF